MPNSENLAAIKFNSHCPCLAIIIMIEDPSALNGGSDTLPSLKILKHDSDLDSDDEESGHYCEM